MSGYITCHANEEHVFANEELKKFYHLHSGRSSQTTEFYQIKSSYLVKQFYIRNNWQPVWITNKNVHALAGDLLNHLNHAQSAGLNKLNYFAQFIDSEMNHEKSTNIEMRYELELLLTDAFLSYVNNLLHGQLRPDDIFQDWQIPVQELDVVSLLERVVLQGNIKQIFSRFLPVFDAYKNLVQALVKYREIDSKYTATIISAGPALKLHDQGARVALLKNKLSITDGPVNLDNVFDSTTLQAVYRFQERHGLETDGIVGQKTLAALNVSYQQRLQQIEINLERMRWLPRHLGDKYIIVNIPDFSVNVIENDQVVLKSRAIVGKKFHETPVFSEKMTYLDINPYWNIPNSISLKEILPKQNTDPHYLKNNKMRIFDSSSNIEIDPNIVDWSQISEQTFSYRIRQEPGPENALGRVKFIFPNKFSIYMHDTPGRNLFSHNVRNFSHSCIRVEKAIELAKYFLQEQPSWNDEKFTEVLKTGKQHRVLLIQEIPVYILYLTAWVDNGVLQFRSDIYGRDLKIINALAYIKN